MAEIPYVVEDDIVPLLVDSPPELLPAVLLRDVTVDVWQAARKTKLL